MDVCRKPASINDLPPEILVRIFSSFLKSERSSKLYTVLPKVCMAWQKVALNPSLCAEASFTAGNICHICSIWEGTDFLEKISLIKTLNFSSLWQCFSTEMLIAKYLGKFLEACCNLENFNLECCDSTWVINILFNLPTFCPKITCLQIEQVPVIEAGYLLLNWVEKYSINLTRLTLRCVRIKDRNFTALSQKIAECCPNLTNFEVSTDELHDYVNLNAICAGCPKLKELCLQNVTFKVINDSTSCFLHLEKFCLIYNTCQPHYTPLDMVWMLERSKELKELALIGLELHIKNLLRLSCKSLKKLSISHYDDDSNRDLCDVLCQWKHSLRDINIRCNKISQDSLFCYIEKCGKDNLESLSVVCFSPLKMPQIKRSLRQCAKLILLDITIRDYFTSSVQDKILLNSGEKIKEWLNH